MSTVIVKNVQVGNSGTATNNFTWYQPASPDGTVRLGVGNTGATTADVLVANSSSQVMVGTATPSTGAALTVNGSIKGTITSGTAVASTSGTSIDFTGIPSWVRRITVIFNGVSTNGTSPFLIQIGAGSVTTTGYSGAISGATSGNAITGSAQTTGFGLTNANIAANTYFGQVILLNMGSNVWQEQSNMVSAVNTYSVYSSGGGLTLGGALDRVRITTVNGTDAFDAGTINILYEG